MRTTVRVFVASAVLVAAGCTGGDDSAAPTTSGAVEGAPSVATTQPEVTTTLGSPAQGSEDRSTGTDAAATSVPSSSTSDLGPVPTPPDEGGESIGPLGDTELDLETDEGTVQIGDGEVPAGLDAMFPLPDDLAVQLASETATDLGFSGTTALSIEELTEFYAGGLPEAGYEITATQLVDGVLAVFTFEGRNRFGQVAISETPGASTSTVLVAIGDGAGQEETVSG